MFDRHSVKGEADPEPQIAWPWPPGDGRVCRHKGCSFKHLDVYLRGSMCLYVPSLVYVGSEVAFAAPRLHTFARMKLIHVQPNVFWQNSTRGMQLVRIARL